MLKRRGVATATATVTGPRPSTAHALLALLVLLSAAERRGGVQASASSAGKWFCNGQDDHGQEQGLATIMRFVCDGCYFGGDQAHRRYTRFIGGDQHTQQGAKTPYEQSAAAAAGAAGPLRQRLAEAFLHRDLSGSQKRGIIEECCYEPCTLVTLTKYCCPSTARDFLAKYLPLLDQMGQLPMMAMGQAAMGQGGDSAGGATSGGLQRLRDTQTMMREGLEEDSPNGSASAVLEVEDSIY